MENFNKAKQGILDIQKKREEEERQKYEDELNRRMRENDIQLKLWNEEQIPFYSQDRIENKSVWLPNTARVKSYEVARSDTVKITVGKAGGDKEFGVLKTKHKDVLYAVLAIWGSNDWPTWEDKDGEIHGYIKTSRYKILHLLLQKNPGKDNYKSLMDTLQDLKAIPVVIEDLETDDPKEVFTTFSNYRFREAGMEDDDVIIYLNPKTTREYYEKIDVKLLFFDTYRKFKSDTAKTLYPIIDRALSGGNREFSVKVEELCYQYGMTKYKYNSEYRKKWKKALKELNNIVLTNGSKISAELYENPLKDLILRVLKIS